MHSPFASRFTIALFLLANSARVDLAEQAEFLKHFVFSHYLNGHVNFGSMCAP